MLFGVSVGRFCIFHPDQLVTLSMHPGLLHKFPDQCYFSKVEDEVQAWISRLRKAFPNVAWDFNTDGIDR